MVCPRKRITHLFINTLLITTISDLEPAIKFCCIKIESDYDVEKYKTFSRKSSQRKVLLVFDFISLE
jgi:hypothetical protein